jgi:hypothetical protein
MAALSKRRFTAGLQCAKRLWLEHAAPPPLDAGREALARAGIAVGALARLRFPGGALVAESEFEPAAAATAGLVADPALPAIYEAAFAHGGARVRVDVLRRAESGGFELIEVKTATRVRERHALDLAYQLAVLEGAGVPVVRALLVVLDATYVHAGGAPDLERLFLVTDLTAEARALVPTVRERFAGMVAVLAAAEAPAIDVGPQCLAPFRCPFFAHCHVGGPEHPLTDLPRLTPEQLSAMTAAGLVDVRDVPLDFPTLTPVQRRACLAVRAGGAVREPGILEALAAIRLPAHFVDFETFGPAIPVYPGTSPFEQVPFQWSDHVLRADGRVEHREFLHDADADPRTAFAASLLAATADAASIVTYSSFESDVLAALAEELPDMREALLDRRSRIVDLLPIVRDHAYHPALRGSFSIKAVLPAFVPTLGYQDLVIRDGLTASLAHATLVDPRADPARRAEIRAHLLAYCARDTEAMLALHRVLGAPLDAPSST